MIQFPSEAGRRPAEEPGVKAGLIASLTRDDDSLQLVHDVPAAQGRVVLHGLHPGDQGVVDVRLELGSVRDQTLK